RANSPPMVPSVLSKISSTCAWLTGLREEEPEKMTSVSESPRRRLAELSPMTQRTASMMLDLPQPLGPTTPVMLVGRCSTVGSTKDLKPDSFIVERRIDRGSQSTGRTGRPRGVVGAPPQGPGEVHEPVRCPRQDVDFIGRARSPVRGR